MQLILFSSIPSYSGSEYYSNGSATALIYLGSLVFLGSLVGIGMWLWALIDNATKPNDFYVNYRG